MSEDAAGIPSAEVQNTASLEVPAPNKQNGVRDLTPDLKQSFNKISGIIQLHRAPVMILGETGVGKTHTAEMIHRHPDSKRRDKPFIALNMATITNELAESQLFGHKKGSFTGAYADSPGAFQQAEGGTLFLDEIAELSLANQAKLLRALSERKIRPVGAQKDLETDVRIITATSSSLSKAVMEGRFREDLFFRLNGLEIHIPPLRERPNDLKNLAQHFAAQHAKNNEVAEKPITPEAIEYLRKGQWPGNVRQLEMVIMRGLCNALTDNSDVIDVHQLANEFELATIPKSNENQDIDPQDIVRAFLNVQTYREATEIYDEAWKRRAFTALAENGYNCHHAGRVLQTDHNDVRKLVTREFDTSSTTQLVVSEKMKDWTPTPHHHDELVTALSKVTTKPDMTKIFESGWEAMIRRAMEKSNGLIGQAASMLETQRSTLNHHLKKFKIRPDDFKNMDSDKNPQLDP